METYEADTARLQGELDRVSQDQAANQAKASDARRELQGALDTRAQTEANKTRTEREAQEKNKSILTMERACALLEQKKVTTAMEERQVTIDGETLPLPTPFVVMATQNPVESESTFRLPAAQMDRFLIRLSMGYPAPEEERRMLFSLGDSIPLDGLETVTSPEELVAAQDSLSQIRVSPEVAGYLVSLVGATRSHPMVRMGASPRAARALFRAARAWAAMAGRSFVTPDDIQALIHPVLAHRLLLTNEARLSGVTADGVLDQIAAQLPVPPAAGDEFHGA